MTYMAREDRIARRRNLDLILPGARTIVVAALDYSSIPLPTEVIGDPSRGRISNYAWNTDYHAIMLQQLASLVDFLRDSAAEEVNVKAYVDTGAVLERSHAVRAGLGFFGKNTVTIHPRRGSYFFIGEIITDLALDFDIISSDQMPGCGTCRRCLDTCPTHAFPRPYVLDARRCISYLTIEHHGTIPVELRSLMGNWVFGCDECQEVCPWQRFASPRRESAFAPVEIDRAAPRLETLLRLDDVAFRMLFDGSAIHRIGRDRLVRNACIAAGNSGIKDFRSVLTPLLRDKSALVRVHAAWALGSLRVGFAAVQDALRSEPDTMVIEEMRRALTASRSSLET